MRAVVSILDLYARRNLLRVLAALVLMAGLQLGFYSIYFSKNPEAGLQGLETIELPFVIINFAAVVVISFFLSGMPSRASNRGYAVRLLRVSDTGVFFLDALFNFLMFIMVWAVQAAVILVCMTMFAKGASYVNGPQGVPVWVYSRLWLNWNIPMEHTVFWLEHLMVVVSMAFACASARVILRRRRVSIAFLLTLVFYLLTGLSRQGYDSNPILPLLCLVCAVGGVMSASWSLKGGCRTEVDDAA